MIDDSTMRLFKKHKTINIDQTMSPMHYTSSGGVDVDVVANWSKRDFPLIINNTINFRQQLMIFYHSRFAEELTDTALLYLYL